MNSQKAIDLNHDNRELCDKIASQHGVCADISEYDQLFGFLVNNVGLTHEAAIHSYFSGGAGDAAAVLEIIKNYGHLGENKKILEFAAGYGRVTRHIVKYVDKRSFFSSDIHSEAADFIRQNVGAQSILSGVSPESTEIGNDYNFIFVLSLFSHLPDQSFSRWLATLYSALAPGGVLLFTTHGEAAYRHNPTFFNVGFDKEAGFGFRPDSDQKDIPSEHYGTMVVTMGYVLSQIAKVAPDGLVETFRSKCWFGLQDEWILRRPA